MKKFILALIGSAGILGAINAQVSTAQDFTMSDCNTVNQNLYSYLDNNEVVIMEFFMTCGTCVTAGQRITDMLTGVEAQYPGMVNFWVLAYTNSYTCPTCSNWTSSNSINALAFDSGAAQVAYYGGFGMPTTVVIAGPQHQVIYNSNFDGPAGDTAAIHTAINNFYNTTGVENSTSNIQFSAYPNPAADILNLEMNMLSAARVEIEMIDLTGKVVKEIANSEFPAGIHQVQVETSGLSNGIYFIRLSSNGKTTQYKISVKH